MCDEVGGCSVTFKATLINNLTEKKRRLIEHCKL